MTIFIVAAALIVYFSIRNSAFYSYTNIVTMAQYIAPIAVIGAGEVLLLDLAEIDLSAGQVYLTAPWFVVLLERHGLPVGWGIAISLLLCVAIGLFNGMVVVGLRVPSFVATLGTNFVLAWLRPHRVERHPSRHGRHDRELRSGSSASAIGQKGYGDSAIVLIIWALLKGTRLRASHDSDGRQ